MRKLAIVVALSSTVLATPALARNSAWYVGGDFGGMIVEDINFDFGLTPTVPSSRCGSDRAQPRLRLSTAALFVGYDLGAFRIEAEVAYKRATVDDIETVLRTPGNGAARSAAPSRQTSSRPAAGARARSAS